MRHSLKSSAVLQGKRFEAEARFLRSWIERPLATGAITPSGKVLARTMAACVDPGVAGPIVELGPGTGPVTEALLERGVAQERLILVEFNSEFCKLLRIRFPRAAIIEGDAYQVKKTLTGVLTQPSSAVVSSLPLFTKPLPARMKLLSAVHEVSRAEAPFVQFTYAAGSPIPENSNRYTATASNRIWLNFPPARVWVYRRK
jgi:phosphatidylethanolamine/phosphatidyl-N-methylethanolamine N-methyltransferase